MAAERPGRRRSPRWVWATVLTGWAVVLLVVSYVSFRQDAPTVREQRTVAQAQSTVDTAVSDLVRASGGVSAGVIPTLLPYDVRTGCRVTAVRDGEELSQVVDFVTAAGTEDALLKRLADGLPGAYGATIRAGTLRADAGEFVLLRGGVVGSGQVRTTVSTGCRPVAPLAGPRADAPGDVDRAVEGALATLGATVSERRTVVLPCGARTVTVDSSPRDSTDPLGEVFQGAGSTVLDLPELYAYRASGTGVVVRVGDGSLSVTGATGCAPA